MKLLYTDIINNLNNDKRMIPKFATQYCLLHSRLIVTSVKRIFLSYHSKTFSQKTYKNRFLWQVQVYWFNICIFCLYTNRSLFFVCCVCCVYLLTYIRVSISYTDLFCFLNAELSINQIQSYSIDVRSRQRYKTN